MIRKPRFPLALRLGWIETELTAASKLRPAMIADMKSMRVAADDTDARLMILASVAAAALLLLGLNPVTLQSFVDAMGPDGEVDEAEDLGAVVLEQVLTMMADAKGEPN